LAELVNETDEEEFVLYDPHKPQAAALVEGIRGVAAIDAFGTILPVTGVQPIMVSFIPGLALLVNGMWLLHFLS